MRTSVLRRWTAFVAVLTGIVLSPFAARSQDDFIARPVTYVAVGDSVTAGEGATACGGNERCATGVPAPNNGYAYLFARQLQAFHDPRDRVIVLARGGATTADALREPALLPSLHDIVVREQRAGRRVVVSYWLGENDLDAYLSACRGAVDGPGCPVTERALSTTRAALSVVAAAAPDEVLLFDLVDVSALPRFRGVSAGPRQTLAQITGAVNAVLARSAAETIHVPLGRVEVFAPFHDDLRLDDAPYVSADGLHPSDAGHRVLFALMYAAFVELDARR